MTAFVANSNVLDLIGLKSAVEDTFINDADVEVTVKDSADVNVTGVSWPVTMDYVAASNGNYRAILSHAIAFVPNRKYYAHIDADAGADRVGHWEFEFRPQTRTGVTAET
jgi:hypothetical protein